MNCLDSNGYQAPFSLLQKLVNIAKGKVFSLKAAPISLTIVQNLAEDAMKLDTQEAEDKLLPSIRTVSSLVTPSTVERLFFREM